MKKGDVILVRFPFTDLTSEKLSPAIALTGKNKLVDGILAFITTKIENKNEYDIAILQKQKDFENPELKIDSLIKTEKIATLNHKLFLGKIGELSDKQIKLLNEKLKIVLKL